MSDLSDSEAGAGAEPKYRTATAADVPWLVELIESAYRGESSKVGWTSEAHLLDGQRTDEDDVRAVVETADSRIIVVELDGEPVACCQLQHRGTHAYFGMFAVRPSIQGAGLGKKIITEAERVARDELGLTVMEMTVLRQRTDLIAWYERRGYARTGDVRPFPYGDERFGRPRQDDLEFEVLSKDLVSPSAV